MEKKLKKLLEQSYQLVYELETSIAKQDSKKPVRSGSGNPSRPPISLTALTGQKNLYNAIGYLAHKRIRTQKEALATIADIYHNMSVRINHSEAEAAMLRLQLAVDAATKIVDPAQEEIEAKEKIQENMEKVRQYWATPNESAHLIQKYLNTPISADTIRKYVRQNKIRPHQGKVNIGDLLDTIPKLKYA